jgi:hypothetical protein
MAHSRREKTVKPAKKTKKALKERRARGKKRKPE